MKLMYNSLFFYNFGTRLSGVTEFAVKIQFNKYF
jgi:hypothetical protein